MRERPRKTAPDRAERAHVEEHSTTTAARITAPKGHGAPVGTAADAPAELGGNAFAIKLVPGIADESGVRRKLANAATVRVIASAIAGVFLLDGTTALAETATGRTAQGTSVRATVTNGRVTFITMELRARCTDGKTVTEGPGFTVPFAHPQDPTGRFGDRYANLRGTMRLAGQVLSASFTATIHEGKIVGTVSASSVVVASGVRCAGGPIKFHAP
jgi:hypothetical protein